jgi:hypothetical protein
MTSSLVIVGAPRSGTNALRDAICSIPGFVTFPCDEINYAWKHSNRSYPYDDLRLDQVTSTVQSFIRRLFSDLQVANPNSIIVEKTCANCLRLPFVNEVLPGSKYLYIRRNPYDVVNSSLKRWKASLDLVYVLKKARFIPKSDIPYYAARFLYHRLKRYASPTKELPSWGPRFTGMDSLRGKHTLVELCLYQWYRCCYAAESDLLHFVSEGIQCSFLDYSELVHNPSEVLSRSLRELGFVLEYPDVCSGASMIHGDSVGRGKSEMNSETVSIVESFLSSNPPLPLTDLGLSLDF